MERQVQRDPQVLAGDDELPRQPTTTDDPYTPGADRVPPRRPRWLRWVAGLVLVALAVVVVAIVVVAIVD